MTLSSTKAFGVVALLLITALALLPTAVHASSPAIVQSDITNFSISTSCGFNNAQGCFYLTLGSAVTSGDVMVVGFDTTNPTSATLEKVSDSLGNAYTAAITQTVTFPDTTESGQWIYYSGLGNSGSDRLNITFNGAMTATFFVYEVSGVLSTPAGANYGDAIGTFSSTTGVTAISFTTEGFIFGQVYLDNSCSTDSPTAGSGFTYVGPPSGDTYHCAEESVSGVSGTSTTIPITLGISDHWLETGIVLNSSTPVPDLPLGALPLLLAIPVIYFIALRRGKRASMVVA